MNRITRTLMIAAVGLSLPLASFAANATAASATSTSPAKASAAHASKAAITHTKKGTVATKPASMKPDTVKSNTMKSNSTKSRGAHGVDLNAGSRDQLMQLPGVTATVADAIIAGRPYSSRAQLLDKKIVDAKTYKQISRSLTLKAPATKPAGQ